MLFLLTVNVGICSVQLTKGAAESICPLKISNVSLGHYQVVPRHEQNVLSIINHLYYVQ